MTDSPLVTTDWLAARLGEPGVVIIDGSWHMPADGRDAKAEYAQGHIPGAAFFDIDEIADHATDLPHMLPPADQFAAKYPHELSGGQRQRVAIARALATRPRVLLADEPVSMLDVSIRLGVLNLLADLREREGLAILYVTHDIASARYLADVIAVMYAGQIIESGPAAQVTDAPAHPYTQLLLSAAPDPDRAQPPSLRGRGAPPNLIRPPSGCRFHPRCPFAMAVCAEERPTATAVALGHASACWLHATGLTTAQSRPLRKPPQEIHGPQGPGEEKQ